MLRHILRALAVYALAPACGFCAPALLPSNPMAPGSWSYAEQATNGDATGAPRAGKGCIDSAWLAANPILAPRDSYGSQDAPCHVIRHARPSSDKANWDVACPIPNGSGSAIMLFDAEARAESARFAMRLYAQTSTEKAKIAAVLAFKREGSCFPGQARLAPLPK